MAKVLALLTSPQDWPASILILGITTFVILLFRLAARPAWPLKAPKCLQGWPVLGSPGFFGHRLSFLQKGFSKSSSGQFSFFYGPYPIVALSGSAGRKTFYTSRGLDMNEGFAALFSAAPTVDHLYDGEGSLGNHLVSLFKRFLQKGRLESNLPLMVRDCMSSFQDLDTSVPVDPFDSVYALIYQLTVRHLGSVDIANDPKLLRETLGIFGALDDSSALEVMFPRLPVPSRLSKIWAGARLHRIFSKIMQDRRRTGRTEEDPMQLMMDDGEKDVITSAFIMGGIFAGLLNTGVISAWILLFLSQDSLWYRKVQDEVSDAIAKHRYSETESGPDVLGRLKMEDWENEFPMIDYCLRETIRLVMPGSAIRKNVGKDIEILGSGEIIPGNTYAVYPIADVHLDPEVYSEPHKWDPSRYFADRAEDKKVSHAYVGWGSGMHPCLGMKFAKLEVAMCISMFVAFFDFKLVDKNGNTENAQLPTLNHGNFSATRQAGQAFLKCERRTL